MDPRGQIGIAAFAEPAVSVDAASGVAAWFRRPVTSPGPEARAVSAAAAAEVPFWVAPSAFPSSRPFSNWFLAEPRLRASLGMAAPPKRSTTRMMATMSRSGPKMSASMRFSFTWVHVAVNWDPRLDPFPSRDIRTPRARPGIRSHPARRMPMTSAATLARPPTEPQRASWALVVARWCR